MSRYFTQKIDHQHLASIIMTAFRHYHDDKCTEWRSENGVTNWTQEIDAILKSAYDIPWKTLTPKVESDLKKCEFDTENLDCDEGYDGLEKIIGFHTLPNGLTYLGISAGGDWEFPIFFIVYWSGKDLRAYIPQNGNPWNTDTKQAYGNDEEKDDKNAKKRFGVEDYQQLEIDPKLIIKDIETRILPKL